LTIVMSARILRAVEKQYLLAPIRCFN